MGWITGGGGINIVRDSFKSLSTLYATSLIKIEAGLDDYDMYISKIVLNVGLNSIAATDSGFASVWEAMKYMQEQVGSTKLSVELVQVEAQVASSESEKVMSTLKMNDNNQVKIDLTKDLDDLVVAFQTSHGPTLNRSEALYTLLSGNVGSPPDMALDAYLATLDQVEGMDASTGVPTSNRFVSGLTLGSLGTASVGPAPVPSNLEKSSVLRWGHWQIE